LLHHDSSGNPWTHLSETPASSLEVTENEGDDFTRSFRIDQAQNFPYRWSQPIPFPPSQKEKVLKESFFLGIVG
jgi:hypothetical protein